MSDAVVNLALGVVNGVLVQAGVITGGVHGVRAGGVAVVTAIRAAEATDGLIGRDDEVRRLLDLVNPRSPSGPVVLSAVAGMGGIGKTALARQVAAVAAGRGWFPGGVLFVDLRGYSADEAVRPESVFAPLLRGLGVHDDQIPGGADEQATVYHQVLHDGERQGRSVLLVLDNAGSSEQVRDLIPAPGTSAHRVVVTTRDTLSLPGAHLLTLDVLDIDAAVEMLHRTLREHGRAADCGIVDLARVCAGLPLAIRIATGLLADDPDLTAAELAAELTTADATSFAHGETALTAVFAASVDRLAVRDPAAARLLLMLCAEPGPDISTEACAALAGVAVTTATARLRTLTQAHLLARVNRRWRAHDLIRKHARTRPHPEPVATVRLLAHYTATALAADAHLRAWSGHDVPHRFADRAEALAWFDAEHANLVSAVGRGVDLGTVSLGARLAQAMTTYLSWRRYVADWVRVATTAARATRDEEDMGVWAHAWDVLGLALQHNDQLPEAYEAHHVAMGAYQAMGEVWREGMVWSSLGVTLVRLGSPIAAISAQEEARALAETSGDRHGEAIACNNLGLALRESGRSTEAVGVHHRAVSLMARLRDRRGLATAYDNLGLALREAGEPSRAEVAHRAAARLYREVGDRHGEATAANNLGAALRRVGKVNAAITAHRQAVACCRWLGDRSREGVAWVNLGLDLWQGRRGDEARRCWTEAAAAFRDANSHSLLAHVENLPGPSEHREPTARASIQESV
ncbi:tetratricopeptide repeat protein [Actinokineospora terrae]|uniref:tetratricopeptide repeat protein n=1 Tax=Actinokineospora terrae TaxID=155974 RepID=UPI0015A632A7|nr:tetratricopeptide repeat protein [Actinokineospora terrae]